MIRLVKRAFGKKASARLTDVGYEYPVDPCGNREGSNAAGVYIDGFLTQLEGEPPVRQSTVHGWIAH